MASGLFATLTLASLSYEWIQSANDDYSDHLAAILIFGGGVLFVLLFLNLFFCVRSSKKIYCAVGCAISLVPLFLLPYLVRKIDRNRQEWFIARGIREYEKYVTHAQEMRDRFSNQPRNIGAELAPGPFRNKDVMASTNADGSLFLMFIGRGNDPRAGYVYYDGAVEKRSNDGPNLFYIGDSKKPVRKLTNHWYEYVN